MNKNLILLCFLAGIAMMPGCGYHARHHGLIENGFVNPPDSIQTSVYWYWISGNISEEGVVNDLHAMKKAGINRAFVGNIGLDDIPHGEVPMFSDQWWNILHTALKTATELDIDIGIFNSPGWSQSGGPWVKPEEAMRYLTASETMVTGPQRIARKLERPSDIFGDVKVIAYPLPADYHKAMDIGNVLLASVPAVSGINAIMDGDRQTGIDIPATGEFTIDLKAREPFTARSLSVYTTEHVIDANAVLQARNDDGSFGVLAAFKIDRSNAALNVGFAPWAPVVVSFPTTTATHYRLVITNAGTGTGLAEIVLSTAPRVERYPEKTLAKMHPTPLPYWHNYQWRVQPDDLNKASAINPASVVDVSGFMSPEGVLTWDVPPGDWVIMRSGMTPTGTQNAPAAPEATGYETDKMSKPHVTSHFYAFIGEILNRIPARDRKSFKVVVQDSYETGGQNFTDDFIEQFTKHYGYSPLPYLPVYSGRVVGSRTASDRFLWDMRRLVADKVAFDYVGGLREVSNKHGLTTWLENYGHWGFPGEFLMYGGQSDEIGGEFWSEGSLGDIENRAATSCGHIYGKTKISAESNTCAGNPFARYPALLKQRGDRFFAEGINNTLLHVYISQPYEDKNPGVNAWFGNEFNRKNTWFAHIDLYTDYLKRCNYMLQLGLNVADAAYFIGEDAPKMTGITDPPLPAGYQFDYMNAEVITKFMTVEDGMITLPHGTQYRILVLPPQTTMRPVVLDKIKQLVYDGAVALGPAPESSPSLQDQPEADRRVREAAATLWGEVDGKTVKWRKYGKGMILNGMTMEEAFKLIECVPDCKIPGDGSIHYGHRTLPGTDIYFISNQTARTIDVTPEFRVSDRQPELWNPVTGHTRKLPVFILSDETTSVPLKLEPFESVFVVFHSKASKPLPAGIDGNYPAPASTLNLEGPWTVRFEAAQRGPDKPVVFEALHDWTTSGDDRIKYYSGAAVYSRVFAFNRSSPDNRVYIDLGNLTATAKVIVNGQYAGGAWTAPYRVDVSDILIPGENQLEIEVVNTWVNRLIGDKRLPEDQRLTWCFVNPYNANSPLQPSGLFGPVQIMEIPGM